SGSHEDGRRQGRGKRRPSQCARRRRRRRGGRNMGQVTLHYEPTARQRAFHASKAFEVLYGGAAGGGKSYACVWDALLRCLRHPGTEAFLFRRTYQELEKNLVAIAQRVIPPQLGTYSA